MRYGQCSRLAARSHTVATLLVACAFVAVLRPIAATQIPPKAVLILIPLQRDSPWAMEIDGTIRTVLNNGLPERLDYYTEYLDVVRFAEPDYQPAIRDFFRRKYARHTFDVVVAPTDAMADFVNAYRGELFPGAAVVFAAQSPRPGPKTTGVILPLDLKRSIDVAIQLHPDLRQVFVVSGVSDADRWYQDRARAQFREFDGRLAFTYSSGLAMPDLLRRVSALPRHTIVYFVSFYDDGHGSKFDEVEALDRVAAVANVPTYVWNDTSVGHGSVGGSVLNTELAVSAVANVALRVLKGESPERIPVREIDVNIAQFDWRQLQRWGISERRLPAGSVVRFRQPSLWSQYKFYIVGATGVLVLQTMLIAGLLLQRVRRRRVESALRESEQRFRMTAEQNQNLSGRLINAQEEERARIARDLHDDIGQRVASFSIALSHAKRGLTDAEHPVREELGTLQQHIATLSTDLRQLSHDLHPIAFEELGLLEALRARCDDFAAESAVEARLNVSDQWQDVPDEVALCLYRVAQEALRNVALHAAAHAVTVSLDRRDGYIVMQVTDDGGGGVHASASQRSGLGLVSLHERVKLLGGTLELCAAPDAGTTLAVTLPVGGPHAA